jgi:hypothetical protein
MGAAGPVEEECASHPWARRPQASFDDTGQAFHGVQQDAHDEGVIQKTG